ncbi:RodZ domain-containing protein [Kribbella sp. NPDC051770]|uniref:helix-turn-helix domain-containing protein n=1 Tax=Kribbella sp. NPDC051770 TaxID=3155413 RepID=UPI00344AC2C5
MTIGSELTAARERADLSIEQLSAATRIRTGLLVAMEADDFSRCGGNFYARGHIRSIARVVKADPAPLLAAFDEAYPPSEPDRARRDERIEPRKPRLHPVRPRWAVVVGAILVGLMGWGMVRLFTLPSDVEANASRTSSPTPAVTTPAKPTATKPAPPKPSTPVKPKPPSKVVVVLKSTGEGTYVTLRNYYGEKLFQGLLGTGSTQTVTYPGSIRVQVGALKNLTITINGKKATPTSKRFLITPTGAIQKTP